MTGDTEDSNIYFSFIDSIEIDKILHNSSAIIPILRNLNRNDTKSEIDLNLNDCTEYDFHKKIEIGMRFSFPCMKNHEIRTKKIYKDSVKRSSGIQRYKHIQMCAEQFI